MAAAGGDTGSQLQRQAGFTGATLAGEQGHPAGGQPVVDQPLPRLRRRVAPGGHPQRRGGLNCTGQRLQGASKIGLRHGHRLAEAGGPPVSFALQYRQGLLSALVAFLGQRAGFDVVGQRHQVQERLRLHVRRQFLPLEGRDGLVAIVGRHAGTSSISSAAWRWASHRGQPFISARVSA